MISRIVVELGKPLELEEGRVEMSQCLPAPPVNAGELRLTVYSYPGEVCRASYTLPDGKKLVLQLSLEE